MFVNGELPILPIWLEHELCVHLPIEESFGETFKLSHIK
jgi:hypothetical protein